MSISSATTVLRRRYTEITSARPTATSAAATAKTMIAKTCPAIWVTFPYRQKAARLMFTELSINSMPSRIATAFRRESTPNNPILKSAAAKMRYQERGTMCASLFPVERDVDRAYQCRHQQHGRHFERQDVGIGRDQGTAQLRDRVEPSRDICRSRP